MPRGARRRAGVVTARSCQKCFVEGAVRRYWNHKKLTASVRGLPTLMRALPHCSRSTSRSTLPHHASQRSLDLLNQLADQLRCPGHRLGPRPSRAPTQSRAHTGCAPAAAPPARRAAARPAPQPKPLRHPPPQPCPPPLVAGSPANRPSGRRRPAKQSRKETRIGGGGGGGSGRASFGSLARTQPTLPLHHSAPTHPALVLKRKLHPLACRLLRRAARQLHASCHLACQLMGGGRGGRRRRGPRSRRCNGGSCPASRPRLPCSSPCWCSSSSRHKRWQGRRWIRWNGEVWRHAGA